jgi:hypothetical protein
MRWQSREQYSTLRQAADASSSSLSGTASRAAPGSAASQAAIKGQPDVLEQMWALLCARPWCACTSDAAFSDPAALEAAAAGAASVLLRAAAAAPFPVRRCLIALFSSVALAPLAEVRGVSLLLPLSSFVAAALLLIVFSSEEAA